MKRVMIRYDFVFTGGVMFLVVLNLHGSLEGSHYRQRHNV